MILALWLGMVAALEQIVQAKTNITSQGQLDKKFAESDLTSQGQLDKKFAESKSTFKGTFKVSIF